MRIIRNYGNYLYENDREGSVYRALQRISKYAYEDRQRLFAAPLVRERVASGHNENGRQRLNSAYSEPVPIPAVIETLQ